MNAPEWILLRQDLAAIETQSEVFAQRFFAHLYRLDPALGAMLPGGESQGDTLEGLLDALALGRRDPAHAPALWHELGRQHAAHGVREEHYDHLGTALLMALREVLGRRFTASAEATWACLWGEMAEAMIESTNAPAS